VEWYFFLMLFVFVGVDGFRLQSLVKDLKARHEEVLARFDRLEARLGGRE
jgi:hypothetical protein